MGLSGVEKCDGVIRIKWSAVESGKHLNVEGRDDRLVVGVLVGRQGGVEELARLEGGAVEGVLMQSPQDAVAPGRHPVFDAAWWWEC